MGRCLRRINENYKNTKNKSTDRHDQIAKHTAFCIFLVHGGKSGSSPLIFQPSLLLISTRLEQGVFNGGNTRGHLPLSLLSHRPTRLHARGRGRAKAAEGGKKTHHDHRLGAGLLSAAAPFPRGNPSTCSHAPPAKHCQIDTRKVSFVGKSLRGKRRCRDTGHDGFLRHCMVFCFCEINSRRSACGERQVDNGLDDRWAAEPGVFLVFFRFSRRRRRLPGCGLDRLEPSSGHDNERFGDRKSVV